MNVAWRLRCVNMLYPRCYLRSPSWIMHLTRPRYLDKYPPPPRLGCPTWIFCRRDTLLQNDLSPECLAFHIISVKVPWNIASNSRKKVLAFFSIVIFSHRPSHRRPVYHNPLSSPGSCENARSPACERVKIHAIVYPSSDPRIYFKPDRLNQVIS